jgi:hypothetical protein
MDTDRAPLVAANERRKQIGELCIPTVLSGQPLNVVPLAPLAWFADDTQKRAPEDGHERDSSTLSASNYVSERQNTVSPQG